MKEIPQKIAFLGDYLPRKCGIATFTSDIYAIISSQYPKSDCFIVSVNDIKEGYDYPKEVRFEIEEQKLVSYQRAADFLNFNNTEIVSLQHEFGIYGGQSGSHILALLRDLHVPIVTTLHTILEKPSPEQFRVMKEIIKLSGRLISMTEKGKDFLTEIYKAPLEKIDVIPHGIPDMPFVDPNFYKDQFGVEGKQVLLTFGLLSPHKGIENVLKALPDVLKEFPNVVYVILGATHPNLIKEQGETYRMSLERMAADLGIKKNVIFYNRFVEIEELKAFIGMADIYITPYMNKSQITSGTLAYAFGNGKAVVSTPYWHAEELLNDGRGVLVPFGDSGAIAKELINLFKDENNRHSMRKKAYMLGRSMVWSEIAHRYMESFQKARLPKSEKFPRIFAVKTLEETRAELPEIKLDHLIRMTDSAGLLHHAIRSIPNYNEGYCTDDNARALILIVLLEEVYSDTIKIQELSGRYSAFVNYAFNRENRLFRNFMNYDRKWIESAGSDDCQGRSIWALGTCAGRSKNPNFHMWGTQLFNQIIPAAAGLSSPRAWAFSLLGINEYFKRMSGDTIASQMRDELTARLLHLYDCVAKEEWVWCEEILSYDNGVIPKALILSGQWTGNSKALDIGLKSLRWLLKVQTSEGGYFRPIGSNGFYLKTGNRAKFDQQPIEAYSMLSACLEASRATDDKYWLESARMIFEWFLGRNDLGIPLYNTQTCGCHDALHVDRMNQNQGGESTLAFLLSLAEMHIMENSFRSFERLKDLKYQEGSEKQIIGINESN
ncbi:MAG TPA: glycosyltransferase family 4 protein [Ignavibacteriaceae bacterium]|nr:glycosyltransferase family 4 protein [Ignavibacteriaceae bacterium]